MQRKVFANRITVSAVLVCMVLVAFMQTQVHAATNIVRLYIEPSSVSTTTGSTVTVQIRLDKDAPSRVEYVNTTLMFPARLVSVIGINKNGSHFSDGNGPSITYSNENGTVTVQGTGADLATKADVLVAVVTFATRTAGTAALTFSNDSQVGNLLGGGNVKNYLTGTTPAAITITNPPASATKPSQPSSTSPISQTSSPAPTPAESTPTASGLEPKEDDPSLIEKPSTKATLVAPSAPKSVAFIMSSLVGLGVFAAGAAWLLLWSRRIEASTKLPVAATSTPATETADGGRTEAAVLAAAAEKRISEHPTIHSVETVQHHPMQPSAKLKLRRRPVASPLKSPAGDAPEVPTPEVTPPSSKSSAPTESPAAPVTALPRSPSTAASSLGSAQPEDMFEAGEKRLKLEGLGSSPNETSPEKGSSSASL